MLRHHTIITGTGRAGTTFLVTLLTKLGLSTGYKPETVEKLVNQNARCGLEGFELGRPQDPYIVKHPLLCKILDAQLTLHKHVRIDYAIVPIRNLHAAAQSRINVSKTGDKMGTLWQTDSPHDQADVLAHTFYELMVTLAKWQIAPILLSYPRLIQDPGYLHRALLPVFTAPQAKHPLYVTEWDFTRVFKETVKPEWVHQYGEGDK